MFEQLIGSATLLNVHSWQHNITALSCRPFCYYNKSAVVICVFAGSERQELVTLFS
jgi:hypothetical protein